MHICEHPERECSGITSFQLDHVPTSMSVIQRVTRACERSERSAMWAFAGFSLCPWVQHCSWATPYRRHVLAERLPSLFLTIWGCLLLMRGWHTTLGCTIFNILHVSHFIWVSSVTHAFIVESFSSSFEQLLVASRQGSHWGSRPLQGCNSLCFLSSEGSHEESVTGNTVKPIVLSSYC